MNRKRLTLVAQYSLINQQISGSIGGSDKNPCLGVFKTNVPKCFTLEEVDQFERFLTTLSNKEAGQSTGLCSGTGKQCSLAAAASLKRWCNSIAFVWGMIHCDFHKKGFGEQLLLFRLNEIKLQFPNRPIILDTIQFSYSFFEKYGFKTVKITENSYGEGMYRYDMILETS